jgi:DNA-binding response OmpR family regulator
MEPKRPTAVLIIDDETSVQRTLGRFLDHHGFLSLQAGTIDSAIATLGREYVDAVILDVRLPDDSLGHHHSGLELLAYLRRTAEYAHLPVLVLTGNVLTFEEKQLIQRYGAYVFYKPQPFGSLVHCLHQVADHTRQFE